jgi:dihydrofolate synthase/folylpolyglutamate synthase
LDGAHNPDGAHRLADFLGLAFSDYRVVLVLGVLEDKDRAKIVQEIAPLADAIIVTAPPGPRAGDWAAIADQAGNYTDQIFLHEKMAEALLAGIQLIRKWQQKDQKSLLCVAGSLCLVAEARGLFRLLQEKNKVS